MSHSIPEIVRQQLTPAWQLRSESLDNVRSLRPSAAAIQTANREKVVELAREFEAMMTRQVLQQMRQSMTDDDTEDGYGAETMTETVDMELSRALAGGKGFGLARALTQALEWQTSGQTAEAEPTPTFVGVNPGLVAAGSGWQPTLSEESAPAVPLPLGTRITSHFGTRLDPLGPGEQFHRGIDIAAPSGSRVPAVADGRVTFAGESGGYGNTVVVQHANGTSTRYAHLSGLAVHEGDPVHAGDAVGSVGSTGRSTGPHLHFEVLQDGRPVNPELAAARYGASLKYLANVAD